MPAVVLAAVLSALGAGEASARGSSGITRLRAGFGIGDQSPALFTDPRFAWLGVRTARLVVPYDVMGRRAELAEARTWLFAARVRRISPFVVFSHSTQRPRLLPSVIDYRDSVRAFLRAFPWVHAVATWDEENHVSQPTAHHPVQAARYYMALRSVCVGCAIVAADVLDEPGMASWIVSFRVHAPGAHLWGLHNYFDINRGGTARTRLLLSLVPGTIWFTETGGLVWRYDAGIHHFIVRGEQYAARAARRLAALVAVSPRIQRVFYYHWREPRSLVNARRRPGRSATWDSGLVRPDCGARPAFLVIASLLGRNARRMPPVVRDRYGNCSTPPPRRAPRPTAPRGRNA